jgi:hypothetical protein
MKRVKNEYGSFISNERLSGHAIMFIHWDLNANVEQLIDRLARKMERTLLYKF